MKASRQRERGFTLIEIMMAVIIMGLLAAIAVPNMDLVFSRNKLRGSTTSVTSSLYLARMKAINDGLPYGVEFSGNGMFQIYRDPYNANEAFGTPYQLDAGLTFSMVSFVDSLAVFTAYGQLHKNCLPSNIYVGTVRITDSVSDTTNVEVTFLSGRIRETNR
ncbi:Tfp pilus assembly protein FimT/FimU [Candidatus Latescibacterota bacterium]